MNVQGKGRNGDKVALPPQRFTPKVDLPPRSKTLK